MDLVRRVTYGRHKKRRFPKFRSGDTVCVYLKVKEGEKERVQPFKGTVIKVQGSGMGRSFTVRKIGSGGIGVEKTIPLTSPAIDRIEVQARSNVRQSRIFYLRKLRGRAARIASELVNQNEQEHVEQ